LNKIKIAHLCAQAVMRKDSGVRGYARLLSPAHSLKIRRGHDIWNTIKREDSVGNQKHWLWDEYTLAIKNNSYKIHLKPPKKPPQPLLIAILSLRLRKFEWLHRDILCQCWPDLSWPFIHILLTQRLPFL